MFEKLLKEIDKMKEMKVTIPINADEEGYYDKECPFEGCEFQFKVLAEDWKEKFKDESVYCPFCGHNAPADHFWTKEQIEQGKKRAFEYAKNRLRGALIEGAKDFNRRQPKKGFITMSLKYKGPRPSNYVMPIVAQKELEQKIECVECGAKYSILGSAFFCPCCGHNSVNETFDNSIKKIESKIKNLEAIRESVAQISADEAEITVRSLIESGLADIVVAFQRYCESTYKKYNGDKKLKQNAFQNLVVGEELWKEIFDESYQDWLTKKEFDELNIAFQKRHLLAHQDGMVDEKYIEKTGDQKYKAGQRIVVKKDEVLNAVKLVKKIIKKIKQKTENL